MASEITIPPAALEAGARAVAADHGDAEWKWRSYEDAARAAFVAMVTAWEGMQVYHAGAHGPNLILPLAAPSGAITENPDDKA